MGNEINCTIRVRLTKPALEVMENASRVGRDCGRDLSWKPADLNAAIAEILLWSDDHLGLGVEIIQD